MSPETLRPEETQRIREEFRAASRDLDDVIDQTTRLLGQLSHSLAFVIAPARSTQTFRHIQLIWLSERTGLAVLVTSLGTPTQTRFELSSDVERRRSDASFESSQWPSGWALTRRDRR